MKTILIVSSDDNIPNCTKQSIESWSYQTIYAEDGEQGFKKAIEFNPDVAIVDVESRVINGLQVIERIVKNSPSLPIIVLIKPDDVPSAIRGVQLGASDYIEKPIHFGILKNMLADIIEIKENSKTNINIESEVTNSTFRLIGKSPKMREVVKRIGIISMNRVTTMLEGETGVGKEVVAKVIHEFGITRNRPFVAVNCSALAETLLESELFGHVKGSFTDAIRDKVGKFELASDGTIFLDEISEISPNIQLKLLRVIQESEFERVGGEKTIPMKARIIASTNKSLEQLVQIGKFREDLYYRLKVFNILIPPLRERLIDIPLLINFFIKESNPILAKNIKSITKEALDKIMSYSWPGNVRELEHSITRAMLMCNSDVLDIHHFQFQKQELFSEGFTHKDSMLSLADVEKSHIESVLKSLDWQKSKAATVLGISRPTLNQKIELYGLENKR